MAEHREPVGVQIPPVEDAPLGKPRQPGQPGHGVAPAEDGHGIGRSREGKIGHLVLDDDDGSEPRWPPGKLVQAQGHLREAGDQIAAERPHSHVLRLGQEPEPAREVRAGPRSIDPLGIQLHLEQGGEDRPVLLDELRVDPRHVDFAQVMA